MTKIVVAHVSKQHSFHTAIALKRNGFLFKYITTVYNSSSSLTSRVKKALSGASLKKASSRYCEDLDDKDVLQFYELLGLFRIFISRYKLLKPLNIDLLVMRLFSKKVAEFAVREKVDALIIYDGLSRKYVDWIKAKAPSLKIIMEVTIASRPYMKMVFEKDMQLYKHNGFVSEEKFLWSKKQMSIIRNDFNFIDYFFVPSSTVYNSLIFCGIPDIKIKKIPYGVALDQFAFKEKVLNIKTSPLQLVFVGNCSYRKGVHHLLKVVSQYSSKEVVLTLAGGYDKGDDLYIKYKDRANIKFLGFVTRDAIVKTFQQSDCFVFPTLGEGLALVIIEALSTGTPVICTEMAGGNDLITDYDNGIVCKAGDPSSFENALRWMMNNRDQIPTMSLKARNSVIGYSWENYYERIISEISNVLQ